MEILPGIHVVPGSFWWRVYLIEGDTLALVDTGLPWNARGVLKYIGSIGRSAEELRLILMTHSHPDHTTGGAGDQTPLRRRDRRARARHQGPLRPSGVLKLYGRLH